MQQVPIIGAPMIKGWFVTLLIQCNCEGKEPFFFGGQYGAQGQCPACKKVYLLQGIDSSIPGQMNFQLALGIPVSDYKT